VRPRSNVGADAASTTCARGPTVLSMGPDRIEVWRAPDCVDAVKIAPDFRAIVRSERLGQTFRSCLEAGATIAVAYRGDAVCAYATVVPSSTHVYERWHNLQDVHELGALEVVRLARRQRVASAVLEALARAVPIEAMILFARGFYSHWDLQGTGLPPLLYRRMLVMALGRIGLLRARTDDPEVTDHPMNFLAARLGRSVDGASLQAFARCLHAGA
jgi:hypothetical protein